MKSKLVIIAVCMVISCVALSATDDVEAKDPTGVLRSSVSDHTNSSSTITSRDVQPVEQQEQSEDYEGAMIAITQRFSAALAAIADAVQEGEITSEQGKERSADLCQLMHLQFELLSLWRQIEQEDLARIPDAPANPAPTQDTEIVMVAPPFSSLQLNPSLAEYLGLTPSQVAAMEQVMAREHESLRPLKTQLSITSGKLLAIGGNAMNEKEVRSLARAEADLLVKLIVANARLQSKIYGVLTPNQQKKLRDLVRTGGSTNKKESQSPAD